MGRNWTPRRECPTCNYKSMSVNMPPCSTCILNPEAAEAVLLKEEVYSEELESQLQHAREENDRLRAERDWLAAKMADISDKMNRPDAPTFCAACNICPIGDEEMEGRTCLVAIEEAARRAVAESEVRE
ncbi:hypothetical protein Defa_24900 [Desulfovibrio sp. TH_2024_36128]|uniref:Uncharacterized protein n=2 Tax=Desulfovibrio falkowii TaxID=3136602 RepID=A0ABQ0EB89_9BACT